MPATTQPNPRAERARLELELLARLGLGKGASDQQVEAARDSIVGYLASAPRDLGAWAQREISRTDEAYALLSDSGGHLDARDRLEVDDSGPAHASARTSPAGDAVVRSRTSRLGPRSRVLMAAGALVAVVTVAYAVYAAGSPAVPGVSGTPAPEVSARSAIDQARVGELMQKITAQPNDTPSLIELGNIYFDAGDYKTSADFMTRVTQIDPKNVDALIGLGAADYNQGDSATAEKEWRSAIAIDPRKQEAYYDLGFMYLSQNPPNMANVRAMWDKVIAIDPTTEIAKTVKTHLDSFASSASAGASEAASGAPGPGGASPSASPDTSPVVSPSGTGN